MAALDIIYDNDFNKDDNEYEYDDEYEYYDSDEEYFSSDTEFKNKEDNQSLLIPQNSFVNDMLFTLYNDYINVE